MKVLLLIWISAVLIQEVIPSTLVRLPRHAATQSTSSVHTEYEAKYEQKGTHGNESSGLVSGKQEIIHDNCADNWNSFADKCAALIKDLVASLANAVSSRPGDATKLQLQIKNTFRHFDSTHNCTCLNQTGGDFKDLDLSPLFNNLTISTAAPTINDGSTGPSNGQQNGCGGNCDEKNGNVTPESKGNGGKDDGYSDGSPYGLPEDEQRPRQPPTALSDAEKQGVSPEDYNGPDSTNNSRRQAKYPQVSRQPGGNSEPYTGKPNNIKTSSYPFLVTPQPNSFPTSSEPLPHSVDNNSPNRGPEEYKPESGVPSNALFGKTPIVVTPLAQTTPSAWGDSGTGDPISENRNAYPKPIGENHETLPEALKPAPDGGISENIGTVPTAPVTSDSTKPVTEVPVFPVTDPNINSQPNNPVSLTNNSPENPQSGVTPIQPAKIPENSNKYPSALPTTEPYLISKPEDDHPAQNDQTLGDPVINSHSNLPESDRAESDGVTTNPFPIGPVSNPSQPDVKNQTGIPEVFPPSNDDAPEQQTITYAPATSDNSDSTKIDPHPIISSINESPKVPEADNHQGVDPSDEGGETTPCDTENPDAGENKDSGKGDIPPQQDLPVTVYPVYVPNTNSPVVTENGSGPNGNKDSGNDVIPTVVQPQAGNDGAIPNNNQADDGNDSGSPCEGDCPNTESNNSNTTPVVASPENPVAVQQQPAGQPQGGSDSAVPNNNQADDGNDSGSPCEGDCPNTESNNSNTTPVVASPENPVAVQQQPAGQPQGGSDSAVPNNNQADDGDDSGSPCEGDCPNTESNNSNTTPVVASPENPAAVQQQPAGQPQGGSDSAVPNNNQADDGDDSGSPCEGDCPNTDSNNSNTTPVVASPENPAAVQQQPAGQPQGGSDSAVPNNNQDYPGGEGSVPQSGSYSDPNAGTENSEIIPIDPLPEKPVLVQPQPAELPQKGNDNTVPNNDQGYPSGDGSDPNVGTDNNGTSPVYPVKPVGESNLGNGGPQPITGSGPDNVQDGNGKSDDAEDSALETPTTFQTTSSDPTSPQSILIPTESTIPLTQPSSAPQQSSDASPQTEGSHGDDDDDEDCCSCESCTEEEITDPKQYKENACKNLEEARRELKAIFDKIRKKLKCGKKAPQTITTTPA